MVISSAGGSRVARNLSHGMGAGAAEPEAPKEMVNEMMLRSIWARPPKSGPQNSTSAPTWALMVWLPKNENVYEAPTEMCADAS